VRKFTFLICLSLFLSCTKEKATSYLPVAPEEYYAGGKATVFALGFSVPAPNLSSEIQEKHDAGDIDFEQSFVTAPSPVFGGLGPVFNHISCVGCHPADGRAPFPTDLNVSNGLLFRVSIPGTDLHGGPVDAPGFGGQLQQRANAGKKPEAQINVSYEQKVIVFADGTSVTLRKPVFNLSDPYMPFPTGMMFSPRLAPPVFAMGLLEAIPENRLIALQDVNDADNDGISGKINYVWDVASSSLKPGRFGWKAEAPTSLQQVAGAYHQDMGITNPLFKTESSYGQAQYDGLDDETEINQTVLENVTVYVQTLGPPAPRDLDDDTVLKGRTLFYEANCISCHTPKHITASNFSEIPEFSNQTIYPYTDLLLHDMGDDLADNRPTYLATGNEWQTRPLWGIGLTEFNNGHTNFLHDGRARNIEEAILWHGGEAEASKLYYTNLSKTDRDAVLKFINAL
jgi:CxxC motif-containing protein (DUF1111 family)